MNIRYLLKQLELYSCDCNKNIKCKKNHCTKEECTHTSQYKYAKKTLLNYIKKIINKIRGVYRYE